MQKNSDPQPSVATFADHEVIRPPNKLRRAVLTVKDTDPPDDPVGRAEAALTQISGQFSSWMDEECERLDRARRQVWAKGFTKKTREALFNAAHDIKGGAATFGYPAAAAPADSLCRLIEHTPDLDRIPYPLIDQHVDAVRAIIREHSRPDAAATAEALTKKLRDVTDNFLLQVNRDRPDYVATVLSPPTVPSEGMF